MSRLERYKALVKHLGGPSKAAAALGVQQGTASGWIRGDHGMSATAALAAERVTGGKFKAKDLNEKLCKELAHHAA